MAKAELGDVVDVAVGAGSFKTLVKIVSDLGLVDTLKNAEALTVFAPSDEAFGKLPEGTLESLSPEDAKAIVLRHVVTAKVPAADVATGSVATIGGEEIGLVKTEEGGVQIQGLFDRRKAAARLFSLRMEVVAEQNKGRAYMSKDKYLPSEII